MLGVDVLAGEPGFDVGPAASRGVVQFLQVLDRVVGHDGSLWSGGRVAAVSERTKYTPGTFSWTDLTTTDQDAAKTFYSGLFGWEAQDNPVGDGVVYSMMMLDGK